VQPNAPGTQGYNLYTYVANNPTTWVDPSGHEVANATLTAYVMANPDFTNWLVAGVCAVGMAAASVGPVPAGFSGGAGAAGANRGVGLVFGVCMAYALSQLIIPVLVCALEPGCLWDAIDRRDRIRELGSKTGDAIEWTLEKLKELTIREYCFQLWLSCEMMQWRILDPDWDCFKRAERCEGQGGAWPGHKCAFGPFWVDSTEALLPPIPLDLVSSPFTPASCNLDTICLIGETLLERDSFGSEAWEVENE